MDTFIREVSLHKYEDLFMCGRLSVVTHSLGPENHVELILSAREYVRIWRQETVHALKE